MKKLISAFQLFSLSAFCCLATQCGTFDASYTNPRTGQTYFGGINYDSKSGHPDTPRKVNAAGNPNFGPKK